jgi:hypothetical protein
VFEYCLDVGNINLSAIRTVRVLRPLRAINRIPSKYNQLIRRLHQYNCFFGSGDPNDLLPPAIDRQTLIPCLNFEIVFCSLWIRLLFAFILLFPALLQSTLFEYCSISSSSPLSLSLSLSLFCCLSTLPSTNLIMICLIVCNANAHLFFNAFVRLSVVIATNNLLSLSMA